MTSRLTRWLWLGIAAILLGLPLFPIPRWSGAPDSGPPWTPDVSAWAIGLLVVVTIALMAGRLATRLPPLTPAAPRVPDPALLAVLALGLAAWSAYTMRSVFGANPQLLDEMAQLLHARAFAAGRLAAPPPEPAAAFLIPHAWVTQAGWVSLYPPAHEALLAVGLLLHAETLVNPVLGGVGVVLVYLVARGLYGTATARVAAILWAVSSWVMFMSATYMNHVTATTFALACWALLWAPRPPRAVHLAAAGFCLVGVAAARPLDGVAAGLPVLVWLIARRRWSVIPWMALGALPAVGAWGYLNWRFFGSPLTLGYTAAYDTGFSLGFHPDPWGEPFTPFIALSNVTVGVRRLQQQLYEWPIPALLPLGLWAMCHRQRRLADLVVAVGLLAVPALYFFYWHSGVIPGPRFYYGAAPFLVIGTARAWRWGRALARRQMGRQKGRWVRWDAALIAAAATVLVWGWAGVLPKQAEVYREGRATLKLHPERELAALGVRQALVLVPESWSAGVIADLWALGAQPGLVERVFRRVDTCELKLLGDEGRAGRWSPAEITRRLEALADATPEPVPTVTGWPDRWVRLRPGRAPDPACQRGLQRDLAGFTLYSQLAWRNAIGLASGIVFARDLAERNAELLARYPGWPVWRWAPPPGHPDAAPVLTRLRTGATR
ncbi:MAG TPA: glycosyltransferase family 39 protein [Gemmatimonadales bacterium]|nr:glycosyltransferase family 39 protein [Gemmatimonadales bacterium]